MLLLRSQHALFLALPMSAAPTALGGAQPYSRDCLPDNLRRQASQPSSTPDCVSARLPGRSDDAHGASILTDPIMAASLRPKNSGELEPPGIKSIRRRTQG